MPISSPDSAMMYTLCKKEKRENLYLLLVSHSKGSRIAQLIETSNADPTPICIYMTELPYSPPLTGSNSIAHLDIMDISRGIYCCFVFD